MPVIPASIRQREEDHEFKAGLDYMRPCLGKKKKNQIPQNTVILLTLINFLPLVFIYSTLIYLQVLKS